MSLRLLLVVLTFLNVKLNVIAEYGTNEQCGIQTSENQYPWLANFEYESRNKKEIRPRCTGALVTKRHVVGKAECFGRGSILMPKYVRFGVYKNSSAGTCVENSSYNNCTEDGVLRVPIEAVEKYSIHLPLFTTPINAHDIALVVLREVVPYTDTIRPICLPSADITQLSKADLDLYVTGISQTLTYITRNHQTATNYADKAECLKVRSRNYWLQDDICVIDVEAINPCMMRGALLMNNRGGSYELIGLSEVTDDCNNTIKIFTNFYLYVDWIRNKTSEWSLGAQEAVIKNNTEASPKADVCGKRRMEYTELVTNDAVAKAGDWPWHVAIYKLERFSLKYVCGGTLISKTMVLTAAHCITLNEEPVAATTLSVFLGKYNLNGKDSISPGILVESVIVHEDFTPSNYLENDIALLKLKSQVTYNNYVQPACWSAEAYERLRNNNVFGTVVRWEFDQPDTLEFHLNQITIPMISNGTCMQKNSSFINALNDKKFCAGWANGTLPCSGDSGSGFLVFVPDSVSTNSSASGSWYVRGIQSISISLEKSSQCDPNQYVIFTDVSKYSGWILSHIKRMKTVFE